MTGAAISERIWVTVGGATNLISLEDLYSEYVAGRIGKYGIYYVDPQSIFASTQNSIKKPLVGTMPILEVFDMGIHQKVVLTSEDNLTVTVGASSLLLDIADWNPPHMTANLAANTKHYVTALSCLGGPPGNKIFVRDITNYYMSGSCNTISLPTPNMITESGFVVIC